MPTPLEAAGAAFSVRKNVARLLVPPDDGRLRPLDGLRALSVLWVILFHAGWYARFVLPASAWLSLYDSRWLVPMWRGDFGVDVFFVLSGFLIGGVLLDEEARSGDIELVRFYVRRALRLWPALLVVAAAKLASDDPMRFSVWANVLYVNDFLPVLGVVLGWTWSLSLEEQFYLVFPLLVFGLAELPTRRRFAALALLAAALVAVAAGVVVTEGVRAFDADVVANADMGRWAWAFDVFYDKPWMRAGALVVGVASAVVYRTPSWMAALGAGGGATALGVALALAVGALATHWPLVTHADRALEVAYLASFRTAFACAVAFVLLVSVSGHRVGDALARPLSSRLLYPVSQLAYSAYLVNPLVTIFVGDHTPARLLARPSVLALLAPCDLVGTLGVASLIHLAVERPFMNLRPQSREHAT